MRNLRQIVSFLFIVFLNGTARAQPDETLEFSVKMSPLARSASEKIVAIVSIKNVGRTGVYVYNDLHYLISSFAATDTGEDISRNFIEEVMPPPPSRSSFLPLEPGDELTLKQTLSLPGLGIVHRGKYVIKFQYKSQFGQRFTFGLPAWKGTLNFSQPIEVAE